MRAAGLAGRDRQGIPIIFRTLRILLYEMLTGRTPFDPDTLLKRGLDEIRRVVRELEPPETPFIGSGGGIGEPDPFITGRERFAACRREDFFCF